METWLGKAALGKPLTWERRLELEVLRREVRTLLKLQMRP
jgi:hypothetical protein